MKKILMCSPDHYAVTYKINPWMDTNTSVNKILAQKQWLNLKNIIEDFLEIEVEIIKQKPDVPDMVFSADQGIVIDKTFIQANFIYPQRQKETRFYQGWFKQNGYQIVRLPKKFKFEGGDFLFWGNKILAGYGFRTNKDSHYEIARITGRKVISLELINPFLYHLDLGIFPLDEQTLVYYPNAFSSSSRQLIERTASSTLKASHKDALNLILNALIYKKRIITNRGVNGLLPQLVSRNFRVVQTDISEFTKSGGGAHCLTCHLN